LNGNAHPFSLDHQFSNHGFEFDTNAWGCSEEMDSPKVDVSAFVKQQTVFIFIC
jgi:hypothetical protein